LQGSGFAVPVDLVHFAVSSSLDSLDQLIGLLPLSTLQLCLDWKDVTGERAVDVAFRLGRTEAVDLLKKNGYRIDTASNVSQGFIIVKCHK
jgi:hypothetical protein